ncbi:MAG: 3-deoxy-manno-octulosonate cytidylyltransferase [Armatimonadaceae bacterium]
MGSGKAVGIIPARLAATRLPNKPLIDLGGKTMIQRVYERAQQTARLTDVFVATPDPEIFAAVEAFGGKAVMTSAAHRTGTDRVAEAASLLPADISVIVNIQGDEPLIDPATVDAVAAALLDEPDTPSAAVMASLMAPLPEGREDDPNAVKVVCDSAGFALYFSRAAIPYRRNPEVPYAPQLHCGLYSYRRAFLAQMSSLPQTPLEQLEALEQLRVLENGYRIRMVATHEAPESVDTPEDLERVRTLLREN